MMIKTSLSFVIYYSQINKALFYNCLYQKYFMKRTKLDCNIHKRMFSEVNIKVPVDIDSNIEQSIREELYKPRHHPGVHKLGCIFAPTALQAAITVLQKEHDKSRLFNDARNLFNYLQKRQALVENQELREKEQSITQKLIGKGVLPTLTENPNTNKDELPDVELRRVENSMAREIYNWKPMEYTEYKSIVYLSARMIPDFAALRRIFSEILTRVPSFQPRTMFDFGSGVGSVTWAMESTWPEICKEAYYVDCSSAMNDLSERIISEAFSDHKDSPKFGPVTKFYRQFLPASSNIKYDLVVSSRSLFEVGSLKMRAQTADILWRKVNPGGFLVLVEEGSLEGHRILMEVRDFLLELYSSSSTNEKSSRLPTPIHVFSPCSHDKFCPRIFHRSGKPCHFSVRYQPMHVPDARNELFSYVVFHKSPKPSDPSASWPRVVQPVVKKNRMVITRMCTSSGQLNEYTVSKGKNSSAFYRVAKATSWGDRYPGYLSENTEVK